MRNKNILKDAGIILILLFMVLSTMVVTGTVASQGPLLEVTTDKTVYNLGEPVTIFLTNVGDELMCVTGPHIIIYNENDEIVFEEACYCYWELEPGDFVTMYWHNPQVPAGEYEIEGILSGYEQDYIDI